MPLDSPAVERVVSAGAEGAGAVGEFVVLEVGAVLGMSEPAAWSLVHDVANLRSRHPLLWAAVAELRVEAWQGRKVADAAEDLSAYAARWVDAKLADVWGEAPWQTMESRPWSHDPDPRAHTGHAPECRSTTPRAVDRSRLRELRRARLKAGFTSN